MRMTYEQKKKSFVTKVVKMEEIDEVDLCLICCSKIKTKKVHLNNNNSQLLSNNLIVFYLLRRVLQVTDNELRKNLISCGNPVKWIRLCDKCSELTRQAEELHRKLRRIKRELSCLEKLIWDKTRLSINSEDDRKLVEETIDLTETTGHVWRRIRNHVANKCNVTTTNRLAAGAETLINPFTEGDKLAKYLITQKSTTAILPIEHSEQKVNEEDDHNNLLQGTNVESTSSSSPSSTPTIKIEATPELDSEEPQLTHKLDHTNVENLLIDNLVGKLGGVKVEFYDQGGRDQEGDADLEEYGGNKVMVQDKLNDDDKVEEEDADWNWEHDDDNEESEVDQEEMDGYAQEENLSNFSPKDSSKPKKKMSKVKGSPQTTQKKIRPTSTEKYRKMEKTEDGKFKCRHCDQTFVRATGCNGHEREKHPKTAGAFICDICGRAFNSRDYLRKHTTRSHKTNPDGTSAMKNRKMIKSQDGKYQCRHCDQIFSSRDGCLAHERNKHSKTPGAFICDICGRAFNSASYLRGHKFQSHNLKADGSSRSPKDPKLERDHICDKCGKGFKTGEQLKKHVRFVHEKSFSIRCTLCGMGWPSKNSLKKHLLALHPEDPSSKKLVEEEGLGIWKCPVIGCSVRFLKESSVKGHLKSKHGKEDEVVEGVDLGAGVLLDDPSLNVTCSTCGKICVNKLALKKHEEVHEHEKKFFCDICEVGFVRKEYLKGHVDRVHLKKRKIEKKEVNCELCGKGFRDRALLRDHLEIHAKEGRRDYFCDKCGHGFTLEKYLRIHKRRTSCGEEGKQARVYNRKGV